MSDKELIAIKKDIITLHGLLFSTMQGIAFLMKSEFDGDYNKAMKYMNDAAENHSKMLLRALLSRGADDKN